ncbi:hypothetical protein Ndes2526B_g06558 [Nannochloris sp. 'desiccata']
MEFTDKFNDKPRVINVLVGPPSCGKSRFLEEVVDQLGLGQNPPLVIFIDSRLPVIVIDEANNLMDWKELDPAEPQLESLLAFLVAISKQLNLVHVVLATSDYFLASWLKGKGLGGKYFEINAGGRSAAEQGGYVRGWK